MACALFDVAFQQAYLKGPLSGSSSVSREDTGQPPNIQSLSRKATKTRKRSTLETPVATGWFTHTLPASRFGSGLSLLPAGLLRTQVMLPLPQV